MAGKTKEERARYKRENYNREGDAQRARMRRKGAVVQALVNTLKMNPCIDCGFIPEHPCQMDFDHKDRFSKFRPVSAMKSYAVDRVLEEISKCDLVCANCHRLRTQKTKAFMKLVGEGRDGVTELIL